jgi:signal transduction histidine kinase
MRRRLALTVVAVTTMVVIAFLLPLVFLVRAVVADRATGAAEQEARSLAGVLAAVRNPSSTSQVLDQLNADGRRRASVILPDGTRLGAAVAIPAARLADARSGRAFTFDGGAERVVVTPVRTSDADLLVVAVAVPEDELRRGVTGAAAALTALAVVLVGLGVVLSDRLARSTIRAMSALGEVTAQLRHGDLAARADVDGPPEVAELAQGVNALATQIEVLLEAEREDVADLSHRLRTPLTALQLEVERLPDDDDRGRLLGSVERLTDEVTALIATARQPRSARPAGGERADLVEVVDRRVAFWSVLARQQHRTLRWARPDGSMSVPVAAEELTAAVDALLANVFHHAPEARLIDVVVSGPAPAVLLVDDDGPGFALDRPDARGSSTGGSSGLGLDIVRRCADATGGSLVLGRSPLGGARAEVRFGP